jgi:uncharacterized protein involved in cysteine biosynthesis
MTRSVARLPLDLIHGIGVILGNRKLLSLCLVPVTIGSLAFLASIICSFIYKEEISWALFSAGAGTLQFFLSWLVFLALFAVSGLISYLVAIMVGSFALEAFAEEVFRRHGRDPPVTKGFGAYARVLLRGVIDALVQLFVFGFVAVLFFALSFIPLLHLIPLILGALVLGYTLVDLPLTVLGLRFKRRLAIANCHKFEIFIIGLLYSFALPFPFAGILLLPPAYYVAIGRIVQWEEVGKIGVTSNLPPPTYTAEP